MAVSPFERGRRLSYNHDWAIFPLATRTTWAPLTGNGHNGATDDEDTIARWMAKWATANYGVNPKLSKLIVIDLDRNHNDGADGVSTWRDLLAKHNGGRDVRTFTVETPGDGLHLYFLDPGFSDTNTPKGKLAPGIDVKWNGYVAGPGSIRDQRSRGDGSTQLGGEYKIISRLDILPAPMPDWLVALVSKQRTTQPTKLDGPKASDHDTVRRVVYMAGVLSRVPEGEASDWINRELPKIGQYIAAGQVSRNDVLVRFKRALNGWTGLDRVMDHIGRQLDYGINLGPRPWLATKPTPAAKPEPAPSPTKPPTSTLDDDDMFSDAEEEPSEFEQRAQEYADQLEIRMRGNQLHAAKYRVTTPVSERLVSKLGLRDLPKPDPLIKGIMNRGASTLFYAGTNVGKSVVVLDMALCIATGSKWLETFPVVQGKVLWIAGEGLFSLPGRIVAWQLANKCKVPADAFDVIKTAIMFASPEEVAETVAAVREGQYDLVVIDTLAMNSVGYDENVPTQMTAWWNEVIKLRSESPKTAVLVIHHEGKSETGEPRGASSIKDVPETALRLVREGNGTSRKVEIKKQRDMSILSRPINLRIEKEPKSGEPAVYGAMVDEMTPHDAEGVLINGAKAQILKWFYDHHSESGCTKAQLVADVVEAGICSKSYAQQAINEAAKSGDIHMTATRPHTVTARGKLPDTAHDELADDEVDDL